jgi:hypothetical protein
MPGRRARARASSTIAALTGRDLPGEPVRQRLRAGGGEQVVDDPGHVVPDAPSAADDAQLGQWIVTDEGGLGGQGHVLPDGERPEELHPLERPAEAHPGPAGRAQGRDVDAVEPDRPLVPVPGTRR